MTPSCWLTCAPSCRWMLLWRVSLYWLGHWHYYGQFRLDAFVFYYQRGGVHFLIMINVWGGQSQLLCCCSDDSDSSRELMSIGTEPILEPLRPEPSQIGHVQNVDRLAPALLLASPRFGSPPNTNPMLPMCVPRHAHHARI